MADDVQGMPRFVRIAVGTAMLLILVACGLAIFAKATYDEAVAVRDENALVMQRIEDTAGPPAPHRIAQSEVTRLFHEYAYLSKDRRDTEWMEVRTLQNPVDLWSIQQIVMEVRPDFIIETGTFHGGSALYLAMLLDTIGGDGKVLTIDIEPHVKQAARYEVFGRRVEVIIGSSVDPAVIGPLAERVKGKTVIVLLDSLHLGPHVRKELDLLGPLVSEGSYLVVQDTNLNGHPIVWDRGPGPWEALEDYLTTNPGFEIERERELFDFSFYPRGYLRRVAAPAPTQDGGKE